MGFDVLSERRWAEPERVHLEREFRAWVGWRVPTGCWRSGLVPFSSSSPHCGHIPKTWHGALIRVLYNLSLLLKRKLGGTLPRVGRSNAPVDPSGRRSNCDPQSGMWKLGWRHAGRQNRIFQFHMLRCESVCGSISRVSILLSGAVLCAGQSIQESSPSFLSIHTLPLLLHT